MRSGVYIVLAVLAVVVVSAVDTDESLCGESGCHNEFAAVYAAEDVCKYSLISRKGVVLPLMNAEAACKDVGTRSPGTAPHSTYSPELKTLFWMSGNGDSIHAFKGAVGTHSVYATLPNRYNYTLGLAVTGTSAADMSLYLVTIDAVYKAIPDPEEVNDRDAENGKKPYVMQRIIAIPSMSLSSEAPIVAHKGKVFVVHGALVLILNLASGTLQVTNMASVLQKAIEVQWYEAAQALAVISTNQLFLIDPSTTPMTGKKVMDLPVHHVEDVTSRHPCAMHGGEFFFVDDGYLVAVDIQAARLTSKNKFPAAGLRGEFFWVR